MAKVAKLTTAAEAGQLFQSMLTKLKGPTSAEPADVDPQLIRPEYKIVGDKRVLVKDYG